MLTNEAKKQILESVLETVEGISNKEYQKRVWIAGKGPEVDDFDETCCNFFGDGDLLVEGYRDFDLTKDQYKILKKFRDEFRVFADENYWPTKFIDTPEWDKITKMAEEILKAFNYKERLK